MKPVGYIPSLDGIRALAVIVVLLSHTGYGDIVPGRAGVTVFFFLSGYLITTLLLREYEKKGTIGIKKFYARRFIRLLPPVLIVLPIVYAWAMLDWIPGEASLTAFLAQLFYLANYFEINTDGGSSPAGLVVLWSLAIEEHFYLMYPILLLPLLKRFRYKQILIIFVGLCGIALLWRMFLVAQPGDIGDRTAFGTDTRFDSILFGCILGLSKLTEVNAKVVDPKKLPLVGWAGLLVGSLAFAGTLVVPGEFFRESVRYTIQGIALFPLFYYPVVYHQAAIFRFLENPAIRKLGVYSYLIYLTHNPIYHLLTTNFEVFSSKVAVTVATFLLSTAVAAVFDKYLDERFRAMRSALR